MASNKKIKIEVAYATPSLQRILEIEVNEDCTIQDAIDQSGILQVFPEIDLNTQKVGIFGNQKKLTDILKENDRIEIYRPLVMDPKDARRKRAYRPAIKRNYKKRGFKNNKQE